MRPCTHRLGHLHMPAVFGFHIYCTRPVFSCFHPIQMSFTADSALIRLSLCIAWRCLVWRTPDTVSACITERNALRGMSGHLISPRRLAQMSNLLRLLLLLACSAQTPGLPALCIFGEASQQHAPLPLIRQLPCHWMYLSACSVRSCAVYLASWNRACTSSTSARLMASLPHITQSISMPAGTKRSPRHVSGS